MSKDERPSHGELLARARAGLLAVEHEEQATTALRVQAARALKDVHDSGAFQDEGHATFAAWLGATLGRKERMGRVYLAAANVEPELVVGRNLDWSRLAVLGPQPPLLQALMAEHAEALSVAALRKVAAQAKKFPKDGPARATVELRRQLAGGRGRVAGSSAPSSAERRPSKRETTVERAAVTLLEALQEKGAAGLSAGVNDLLSAIWQRLDQAGYGRGGNRLPVPENRNDFKEKGEIIGALNASTGAPTAGLLEGQGEGAGTGLGGPTPAPPGELEAGPREEGAAGPEVRPEVTPDDEPGEEGAEERNEERNDASDDGELTGPPELGVSLAELVEALFGGLTGSARTDMEEWLLGLIANENELWTRRSREALQRRCDELAERGALPPGAVAYLLRVVAAPEVEARWPLLFPLYLLADPPQLALDLASLATVSRLPAALKAQARVASERRSAFGLGVLTPPRSAAEASLEALRAKLDETERLFKARGGLH